MVLVGTSLGGAIAMDFALEYPEAVEKLVLVDAQGFIDGLGPWRVAPRWLINLLVQVSANPGTKFGQTACFHSWKQLHTLCKFIVAIAAVL